MAKRKEKRSEIPTAPRCGKPGGIFYRPIQVPNEKAKGWNHNFYARRKALKRAALASANISLAEFMMFDLRLAGVRGLTFTSLLNAVKTNFPVVDGDMGKEVRAVLDNWEREGKIYHQDRRICWSSEDELAISVAESKSRDNSPESLPRVDIINPDSDSDWMSAVRSAVAEAKESGTPLTRDGAVSIFLELGTKTWRADRTTPDDVIREKVGWAFDLLTKEK